ncbi:MAG: hypothetical protein KC553_05685 [Nitrospina sp.]|nr:hypothetical protein [Nitrospina sp.]
MEATNIKPRKPSPKKKNDRKTTTSRDIERQLQDENLKVYHQLFCVEENFGIRR